MTEALYGPEAEPDRFNTRFNAGLGQSAWWYSTHADNLRNLVAEDASLHLSKNQHAPLAIPEPAPTALGGHAR